MTPFVFFTFKDPATGTAYIAEFNRLKRTEQRAKVWPKTVISGMRCLVRQLVDEDERCEVHNCGIGVSYRYKKDDENTYLGMKHAFKRALRVFPFEFRKQAWDEFHMIFGMGRPETT